MLCTRDDYATRVGKRKRDGGSSPFQRKSNFCVVADSRGRLSLHKKLAVISSQNNSPITTTPATLSAANYRFSTREKIVMCCAGAARRHPRGSCAQDPSLRSRMTPKGVGRNDRRIFAQHNLRGSNRLRHSLHGYAKTK